MSKPRKPRSKVLPEPPKGVETPYANCRQEWQSVSLGEKTRVVLDSDAWAEVMLPALAVIEAERPRRGPKPAYSSEELERAILFQKLAGVATYREARTILASDREQESREVLGFDKPRKRYGRGITLVKSLDGVPSEVTVWRHLQRWGLERHIAAYAAFLQRLLSEHSLDPDFQAEARVLNIDGSAIRSHYNSYPVIDKKTGEVIKPPTLEGGGYMKRTEENSGKDGHGFQMVSVSTSTGLPLAHSISPINDNEAKAARKLFETDWQERVAPLLDDRLRVLTGDSAYQPAWLREQLHGLGIVENCHSVSHAKSERSENNAAKKKAAEYQIQGYPNWRANGHRELYCVCGEGKTVPRISRHKNGSAVVRVEGDCKNCGSITITAGKWRVSEKPKRFVRCLLGEEADYAFGNPMTFYNPRAKAFGKGRFGHGEGFHGHMQTRFGLLKHKAWYRRREQAQLDFLMVFCTMHALAIEQRKRAKEPVSLKAKRATAPPGLTQAA